MKVMANKRTHEFFAFGEASTGHGAPLCEAVNSSASTSPNLHPPLVSRSRWESVRPRPSGRAGVSPAHKEGLNLPSERARRPLSQVPHSTPDAGQTCWTLLREAGYGPGRTCGATASCGADAPKSEARREAAQIAEQSSARAKRSGRKEPREARIIKPIALRATTNAYVMRQMLRIMKPCLRQVASGILPGNGEGSASSFGLSPYVRHESGPFGPTRKTTKNFVTFSVARRRPFVSGDAAGPKGCFSEALGTSRRLKAQWRLAEANRRQAMTHRQFSWSRVSAQNSNTSNTHSNTNSKGH